MLSAIFRRGGTLGISQPWRTSRSSLLSIGQRDSNRHVITCNRRIINRYLVSARNSNIHSTPKVSSPTSIITNSQVSGTNSIQFGARRSFVSFNSRNVRIPRTEQLNTLHHHVLFKNQHSGFQLQQVSRFHTSNPNQLPVPLIPAAIFTLKTPVTALALRMISRVSLTLLPLSAKRSPKVILTLVAIPPVCFALVIFAGLEAAPNTGRWRFLFTNEEEELTMLQDELPAFMESMKVIDDENDHRVKLVRHILKNLLSTSIERDGSTLRTGIIEKLEKRHEEAQQRMKELQQQTAETNVSAGSASDNATTQGVVPTKAIVSTQKPVPTNSPETLPEEVEDPELAAITFDDRPFQIFVADNPAINAFSLGPPRLIYINSGLMDWLDNDEDLVAAVVAHELAHVIQRHTMETHGRETVMLFIADVVRSALWTFSIPLGPWFNSWVDSTMNNLLHFTASGPLHQRIEVEADTVSLTLMALAGYDPMHSVRLWELWADKDEREMDEDEKEIHKWTDWMYDHPPSAERAQYLKEAVMPAREMWQKVLNRRKEPVKRFLSLENSMKMRVDEDGDLKDGTVEDVMGTMDVLLKKQQEEEEAAEKWSGVKGAFNRWFNVPFPSKDGSAEPAKA